MSRVESFRGTPEWSGGRGRRAVVGVAAAFLAAAFLVVGAAACGGGGGGGGTDPDPDPDPDPDVYKLTLATPPSVVLDPNGPSRAVRADFNNDGKPDVVTANPVAGTVSVLLGDALGHLTLLGSYPCGSDPQGLAVADLNGDGFPDVVVANADADTVSVLLNAAGASLGAPAAIATVTMPVAVVAGAFDAGATIDLVVVSGDSADVALLPGAGNGTFGAALDLGLGAGVGLDLAAANMDGDADLDLVHLGTSLVSVFLNDGLGGFAAAGPPRPAPGTPGRVGVFPLVTGGGLDVVVSNVSGGTVSVYLNPGDGVIDVPLPTTAGPGSFGFTAADIDGDGHLDLAVVSRTTGVLRILPGAGTGSFASMPVRAYALGQSAHAVVEGLFGPGLGFAVTLPDDQEVTLLLK